jgi:hypothetical protein
MPAYVQREKDGLEITLSRGNHELGHAVAADGVRAISAAMRILAVQDELRAGDVLTVTTAGAADHG